MGDMPRTWYFCERFFDYKTHGPLHEDRISLIFNHHVRYRPNQCLAPLAAPSEGRQFLSYKGRLRASGRGSFVYECIDDKHTQMMCTQICMCVCVRLCVYHQGNCTERFVLSGSMIIIMCNTIPTLGTNTGRMFKTSS